MDGMEFLVSLLNLKNSIFFQYTYHYKIFEIVIKGTDTFLSKFFKKLPIIILTLCKELHFRRRIFLLNR
jgi:hypothetical protein